MAVDMNHVISLEEDQGSDVSSVASLKMVRDRFKNVSVLPKESFKKGVLYQVDLHPGPICFSDTVLKNRRSRSIAAASVNITRRPVVRKIMSSNNLLRTSAVSDQQTASQHLQHDDRRRNAVPNVSYSERKNRRRGSLFVQQSQHTRVRNRQISGEDENGDFITIDEINVPDVKRQSLQLPSPFFPRGRRKSSAGESILSAGSGSDIDMPGPRGPFAANLNRRRRSRAPDSLAKDLELFVPKSNPVSCSSSLLNVNNLLATDQNVKVL